MKKKRKKAVYARNKHKNIPNKKKPKRKEYLGIIVKQERIII